MDASVLASALATLLASSPYLVVLIWIIVRQDARIDTLMKDKQQLVDQLMKLHPPADPDS